MYDEAARDLGGEDCLYVGLTGSGRGAVAEVGRERGVCGAGVLFVRLTDWAGRVIK